MFRCIMYAKCNSLKKSVVQWLVVMFGCICVAGWRNSAQCTQHFVALFDAEHTEKIPDFPASLTITLNIVKIIDKNTTHIEVGQTHVPLILPGKHAQVIKGNGIKILLEKLRHVELFR